MQFSAYGSTEGPSMTGSSGRPVSERALLTLAGGLFLGGFLFFYVVTQLWHPSGQENNHPIVFTKYAQSDAWIAVHFLQFAGVLVALAGFLVLYHLLEVRKEVPLLARCALGSLIATAAIWSALQAVDGVTLKHAIDAWIGASGHERSLRFANAETVRWTEWALQSYYRLLLGLTLVLFGVAILRTAIVYRWLGGVAALAGLVYAAIGVAVGYSGFGERPGDLAFTLLLLVFMVGVLVAGLRRKERAADGPGGGTRLLVD
jgi:hypothetical protein